MIWGNSYTHVHIFYTWWDTLADGNWTDNSIQVAGSAFFSNAMIMELPPTEQDQTEFALRMTIASETAKITQQLIDIKDLQRVLWQNLYNYRLI